MRITVLKEPVSDPELTIRCADPDAPEIQELLCAARNAGKKIPANQPDSKLLLEPSEVLYGEYVGRNVFLYTASAVLPTTVTLAQLEKEFNGFFRCSKSMAVNLNCIRQLKSEPGGRILAKLSNGECILISRRYAGALRRALTPNNEK